MSGYAEVTSAVFTKVDKLIKPLSDEEMKRVASGQTKVALVAPGQQVVDSSPALTAALKVLQRLPTDEDVQQVASGETKIALVKRGQQVVDSSPALTAALKVLQKLSADELQQIEARTAQFIVVPKGAKIHYPFEPSEVAAEIIKIATEPEIVTYLDEDSRLTPPNLKKVAAVLDIVVPPSVKTKPALQLHIAQAVVRDRGRFTWR